jgi:geranylgeranyl diphosphate synthase type II
MRNVQKSRHGRTPIQVTQRTAEAADAQPVRRAWQSWLQRQRRRVDAEISKHLNALKSQAVPHSGLLGSVEYSLANGGKRLRPLLVLEACRVCGGSEEAAWPAALAVECVHTFSLIHDDLPAMDNDDLRRGKPTSHKVFGEAVAILAGDWLVAHAFELLASSRVDPQISPDLVRTLAEGACGMIMGQQADMAGQGRPADAELVEFIHRHKTARLLAASCKLGSLCAQATSDELESMTEYGSHLGVAFQISDDLLDCTGTAARIGKRVGKDAEEAKQTYPAAFGLEESRRRARHEIDAAIAALTPFGSGADRLRHLARYVIARDR